MIKNTYILDNHLLFLNQREEHEKSFDVFEVNAPSYSISGKYNYT